MLPKPLRGSSPYQGEVGRGIALDSRRDTPTLLDSTDLAEAKSHLASLPTRGRMGPVVVARVVPHSIKCASRKYGTFRVERQKPITSGLIIM